MVVPFLCHKVSSNELRLRIMRYIGSKRRLLPFLDKCVRDVVGANLQSLVFCDIFAGSGVVGKHFKPITGKVISNDWEYYSYVLNRHYIGNMDRRQCSESILGYLDRIPPVCKGFIYRNYCPGKGNGRMFFTDYNGMKIDTIRNSIEKLKESHIISDDTYYFLLCSLLESADKVANTTSVYSSYLKYFTDMASKPMKLAPADYVPGCRPCEVYCCDSNDLVRCIEGDILYLDPPYNSRQYGANYHILNTIAEYKPFIPRGKTGLRNYARSSFCRKVEVKENLASIIRDAGFRYIFLSYSNEGFLQSSEIRHIMEKYGRYDVMEINCSRYKADKNERRHYKGDSTVEYLHILEKRG